MEGIARAINLVSAGLLAGNELGTKLAVHPALEELGVAERVRAEQALTRRYGAIQPYWMSSTVVSGFVASAFARGKPGFLLTLSGALCFAGMLASTLIGNVPINKRTLEIDSEEDQREFVKLRERWDRLHTLRVALTLIGLVLLTAGALTGSED